MDKFKAKLILDHLGDRDYTHIDLVMRVGGLMSERGVYMLLLDLIEAGLVIRVEDNKFRTMELSPVNRQSESWETVEVKSGITKTLNYLLKEGIKFFLEQRSTLEITILKITRVLHHIL